MVNRDAISQALSELLLKIQGHEIDQVQAHSLRLAETLESLTRPVVDPTKSDTRSAGSPIVLAELQGLSTANVRFVRSLISEAVALSNSEQWHAAENVMQRAVDRWNEEVEQ